MREDEVPPFLFVVGASRSGTTLVRAIVDAHPAVAVPPESHFVAPLARRRERYEREEGFEVEAFLKDLREPSLARWVSRLGVSEDDLRARLAGPGVTDYRDAVRAMFALYAERHGKPRFADKTPGFVLDLELLAEVFPEARFLHMIRDGRDVALSLRDQAWGSDSIVHTARFWCERVEKGRSAGRALGPERYLELRYEDLVRSPEAAVRGVCGFAGIEFVDEMLTYHERAEQVIASVSYPASHRRLSLPPTVGLRDWRTQMSPSDLRKFEALAGPSLAAFGYPVEHRVRHEEDGDAAAQATIDDLVDELQALDEKLGVERLRVRDWKRAAAGHRSRAEREQAKAAHHRSQAEAMKAKLEAVRRRRADKPGRGGPGT